MIKNKILIISQQEEFLDRLDNICYSLGCEPVLRDSFDYLDSFIKTTKISLVIILCPRLDMEYLSFIERLRSSKNIYNSIPIFAFSKLSNTVTLIEVGVDRVFSDTSFEEEDILKAEIKRSLQRFNNLNHKQLNCYFNCNTLDDLINILNFVEDYKSNSKLQASSATKQAEMNFVKGELVEAVSGDFQGIDAIMEFMTFAPCSIFVTDKKGGGGKKGLQAILYRDQLKDIVKRAKFYYEFMKRYNNPLTTFTQTPKKFDDQDLELKNLYRMVIIGMGFKKIFDTLQINTLEKVKKLDYLISEGFIEERKVSFKGHSSFLENFYTKKKSFFAPVLLPILNVFREFNPKQGVTLEDFSYADEVLNISSSTLLIMGDSVEHNKIFFNTLLLISAQIAGTKVKVDFKRQNEEIARLDFGIDKFINIHLIPPKLDSSIIKGLLAKTDEYFSVIFITSSSDEKVIYNSRFLLHHLWNEFRCDYTVICASEDRGTSFILNCDGCHHPLNVDTSMEGSAGNCPVCDNEVVVPNEVEHLSKLLGVGEDFTISLVDLQDLINVRDIMKVVLAKYE